MYIAMIYDWEHPEAILICLYMIFNTNITCNIKICNISKQNTFHNIPVKFEKQVQVIGD